MRLRPLAIFCMLFSQPLLAITFQTRLEQVQWQVAGDQFECRLAQPISQFGSGEFVRRAGEQATFQLRTREPWLGTGQASLLAAAAPWRPGQSDIHLGAVPVKQGEVPLTSSKEQAARLMTGLLEGRSPLVRHRTAAGGQQLEVRVLPVRFSEAYEDFLNCTLGLLPVNFEQIRQSHISFGNGGIDLTESEKAKIDIILEYLKADPSVNRISLDGHSDNSGNRLTNRDLSRRRAIEVMEYLLEKGIQPEQITMRFHGERYPLVANNNAANRAKNRRVTMTLSRESIVTAEQDVSLD